MDKTKVASMGLVLWMGILPMIHARESDSVTKSSTERVEVSERLSQAGRDTDNKLSREGSRGVTPHVLPTGQLEEMRKHNDEMESHVKDMQRLLDQMTATRDPRQRRVLAEQHRERMHEMMRSMRSTSGEMRMGMMSGGPRSGQPMPKGEKLRQHLLEKRLDMMEMMMEQLIQRDNIAALDQLGKHNDEMEAHMKGMQGLLEKIAATKDPGERRALMEEHRRDMQEMMLHMRSTSGDMRMGMMGGGPRSGHTLPQGESLRQHLLEKRLDMMDMMMDQMTTHGEMMRSTPTQ